MAELALALSESLVLPFEITNYAKFLQMDLSKLESRYSAILHDNGASFGCVLFCIFIYKGKERKEKRKKKEKAK